MIFDTIKANQKEKKHGLNEWINERYSVKENVFRGYISGNFIKLYYIYIVIETISLYHQSTKSLDTQDA